MEDIDRENPRKRIRLDQVSCGADDEEPRNLSQSTTGHPTVADLTSPTYLKTHGVSRTASCDAQYAAEISQSAVSSIDVGSIDKLEPSTQSRQHTMDLEAGLDDQVCFGRVCIIRLS